MNSTSFIRGVSPTLIDQGLAAQLGQIVTGLACGVA